MKPPSPLWVARALIGIVLFFNVQCAILFLAWPETFAGSFELIGASGNIMVRSLGLLFLMWNVPYAIAFRDPIRHQTSLVEAIIMQAIGLAGESLMIISLQAGHPLLVETGLRFIWFDGAGLLALIAAFSLIRRARPAGAAG